HSPCGLTHLPAFAATRPPQEDDVGHTAPIHPSSTPQQARTPTLMLRYVGRRLLQMIPVFFGATLLIYALVFLMPGDPVHALGGTRLLTEAAVHRIRE